MSLRSVAGTSLAVVGLSLVACGGSTPMDCTMETARSTLARGISGPVAYTVKYEVTQSGEGKLTKISYYNGSSTPEVVENPTLPWTKSVTLSSDSYVGIGMEGSVTNGRLEVSYSAFSGGGATALEMTGKKVCEQLVESSTTVN